MASNIIIEPSAPHDPAKVKWLAKLLVHEEVPKALKVNEHVVLVRSSKGGYYSVTRKNGDYWRCSCPAGARSKLCRHLKALSEAEAKVPRETAAQAHQRKQRELIAQRSRGSEGLELMPRASFRPVAEEVLAGERSILGDAPDLVRGSRGRSPRDSPDRLGLSEVA
jgi:hypothetical protein